MMRFCPNCKTERSVEEWFCAGTVTDAKCNWDLSGLRIRAPGWRPHDVVTAEDANKDNNDAERRTLLRPEPVCTNGHPMNEGDLMCLECGADPATAAADEHPARVTDEAERVAGDESTTLPESTETQIDGWRLLRQISSTDGVRERYVVQHCDTNRQAVLTLYRDGAEPDPSVYDVVRRLPREHVPEIIATGRWNTRAYEVAEELSGGTLADLGIAVRDMATIRHVVDELGQALNSFSEAGLRHRDLRPGTLLVRSREPLDLVISGFGSARLSEFDLDIVSPLETTRYMAPEAIAGGVAAASDWWSLGMILLEQLTEGKCFEGINPRAFLIHVLANGVTLPDDLDPALNLLLRGLLARDRHQRWQWAQVKDWLEGKHVDAPSAATSETDTAEGASISLGSKQYHKPTVFALAAAERENWDEARDHLNRGVIVTWAEGAGVPSKELAGLRQAAQLDGVDDDCRLMIALKLLNPEMPLILRGDIVTPGWLLRNPLEGYDLVTGAVPSFLERLHTETWLSRLRRRAEEVRTRAHNHAIELDEDMVRIAVLSTSRAQLAAQWEERRLLLPDSTHSGLLSLSERRIVSEEDLIVLLSAKITQFRSVEEILNQAADVAEREHVLAFDREAARAELALARAELFRKLDDRIAGFARTGNQSIDEWAEHFRLERRLPLHEVLVLLSVPAEQWLEPQKQQYVSQILEFFEKKVATTVLRGPLVRMTIGKTTGRVDVHELNGERYSSAAMLEHLLQRNAQSVSIDPAVFGANATLENRLNTLYRQTSLYKRDTGIDGLYLGFPFLHYKDGRSGSRPRIAPVLLWPVKFLMELGTRGQVALAFDSEREEVRLNPALEGLFGRDAVKAWRLAADDVLGRSALKVTDVVDAFGLLASAERRQLSALPSPTADVPVGELRIACAGVFFHVDFAGQAIGEDLRQMKVLSPSGTALESMLRLKDKAAYEAPEASATEIERFLTVASDPSQESAVMQARQGPGLLVEGPPGTGKSQTIVNMVADAIGRGKSLLIVCQKHAALEVVHKRLVAEGLGDRIVMVNDVNKDREPTIRAVREQLDAIIRGSSFDNTWVRQRERMAARIETLEGELDRQHQALHRVDDSTGLSYRALLGELIQLEAGSTPVSVPQLRAKLAGLDISALTTLEEQCAPLARYWLPARFEGSALAQLKSFATDPATIEEFSAIFAGFREAEQVRIDTLAAHPARFDVDDPAPYRAWLDANAGRLVNLDETQRKRLAQWLPLFRPADKADAPGHAHYAALKKLHQELLAIDNAAFDKTLSPELTQLANAELNDIEARAALATRAPTFFNRLNPATYVRRSGLKKYLCSCGAPTTDDALRVLLAAARLEQQWRPKRDALNATSRSLHLDTVEPACGPTLAEECRTRLRQLEEVRELAQHIAIAPRGDEFDSAVMTGDQAPVKKLLDGFETAFVRYNARQHSFNALSRLEEWVSPELADACRRAIAENVSYQAPLNRINDALPTLAAYQQFRTRSKHLNAQALEVFAIMRIHDTALANVPSEDLDWEVRRLINREARLGWKRRFEQDNPELLLDQTETAAKVEALAGADEEMRRLNREVLRNGIDRSKLGSVRDWEDVTRLSGRRSRRLREFIELGAGLGLMALRPVWMMNPDVASRVLPLKSNLFDSVVYDEASQMPVEYAIPTLFRGGVSVVSGDEKQMPPAKFFSGRTDSDETEIYDGEQPDEDATEEERELFEDTWNRREIKDCPDLLQLARSSLPITTLQIHYRSAYRELIGYSNAAFYDNELSVPVRHPEATIREVKPLELIPVNGIYERQTNSDEADRVVEYLAQLWKRPYDQRPSVGVVTFNLKQSNLIEERLEIRAEEDEAFRNAYREESDRSDGGEDMGVFVKNVENVQGDERDVIVFSTTFGRNSQGAFKRFFGVLGQKGGERRLNVAVTRARKKVVLVTSMPIRDISDMLNTKRKPAIPRDYLQGYLEYARAMSNGELPTGRALLGRMSSERAHLKLQDNGETDGFATDVLEYLRGLGLSPVFAQEGDAFGLDFAIADPETGLYAIGIECDAPRHHLLQRARAREIWRPSVLRRAIPTLHRVSSQAWYHEPAAEKARLKAAIDAALKTEVAA
ncbi:serine/threonine protein kinase [Paraburkholderia fungorum]|jgi:primosomal replication protein N''|uniref:AAA domain-containing protein n=1 Tax=Paraburkholderia fungorum TaxID=134537 RepID=UPI000D063EC3|nr:AAA domain-containing protein [Paraburkholderia fungorum]PRZ52306.1 serine/threonine protein kinase [Paraburkholderia fungorum]